jgi:RimJ/RimL family protein N-acetyltransferase
MQKKCAPLWCKNANEKMMHPAKGFPDPEDAISFRSLDPEKDLALIHDWVNKDYTRTFWQMRGSIGLLRACYQCIQQNPLSHSFIGLINDAPVCQFDIYRVSADELAGHVEFDEDDCGFHLLMSPLKNPVHGLTTTMVIAFLDLYFLQNPGGKMFAEPDTQNIKSIDLLERIGFEKLKTVQLSYKTAHVYSLNKENFYAQNKNA